MDGDKISVVPERVQRLTARLKAWVKLRKTLPRNRKIAILVRTVIHRVIVWCDVTCCVVG